MERFEERIQIQMENEGLKMHGVLHKPYGITKGPGVLFCHGFGGHKVGKYRLYVLLAERLSKMGISSLRFDFRFNGDSEGDFDNMTIAGEISDTLVAIDYLRSCDQVDPARIGIFGKSLGGIVAVRAAAKIGDVKSLALWAPAFHAEQWAEKWVSVQAQELTDEMRDELMRFDGQMANERFLAEFFGLDLKEDLRALDHVPLLHIHGEQDEDVNITHAEMYEMGRQMSKAETRIIRLPNTSHDFSHLAEQAFTIEETSKWFQKTL